MHNNDDDPNVDCGGHPLFPRPVGSEGPDPRKFDFIRIVRRKHITDEYESCPVLFRASELRSWVQVIEMFGGEYHYRLLAICSETGCITAWSPECVFGHDPPAKPFTEFVALPPVPPPAKPAPFRPEAHVVPQTPPQDQPFQVGVFKNLLSILVRLHENRPPIVQTVRRGRQ